MERPQNEGGEGENGGSHKKKRKQPIIEGPEWSLQGWFPMGNTYLTPQLSYFSQIRTLGKTTALPLLWRWHNFTFFFFPSPLHMAPCLDKSHPTCCLWNYSTVWQGRVKAFRDLHRLRQRISAVVTCVTHRGLFARLLQETTNQCLSASGAVLSSDRRSKYVSPACVCTWQVKKEGEILSPVGFRSCLGWSNKPVKYFLKSDLRVSTSHQAIF